MPKIEITSVHELTVSQEELDYLIKSGIVTVVYKTTENFRTITKMLQERKENVGSDR